MKALLIKDFKLMKQQIFIYIIIIACIGIVSYMETIVHLSINFVFMDISFLAIIMTILSMNAINNDESFNSCPYILSLPINRQTYIIEKYAFGMILGIVSMITIWMINLIIGLIPINRLHDFASIACVLSLPLMITIQSFIIPIRFMIHDRKGKNALLFLICILFIAVFVGSRLLISYIYNEYYTLQIFSRIIFSMNFPTLMIIWLLISLMLLLISIKLSINIFNKKEF